MGHNGDTTITQGVIRNSDVDGKTIYAWGL